MVNIFKQVAEVKTASIDFSPVLSSSETITVGNITVSVIDVVSGATPSPSVVSSGSIGLSGNIISFRIQNGVDSNAYKIVVNTGLTNLLNKHEEDLILVVNDDLQILITVDEIKRGLSITDTSKDILLFDLVKAATDFMEKATNRTFTFKTYTETSYPETRETTLLLNNFPVESVTSVVIDGITLDEAVGTLANYVTETEGVIRRTDGGSFPVAPYKTTVVYKAGFTAVPEDVRNAVRKIVSWEFMKRQREGIKTEQLGSYRVTFKVILLSAQDEMVGKVIERYRKRVL